MTEKVSSIRSNTICCIYQFVTTRYTTDFYIIRYCIKVLYCSSSFLTMQVQYSLFSFRGFLTIPLEVRAAYISVISGRYNCMWRHHLTKEPPKLLSSSGMRWGIFISVDNVSTQEHWAPVVIATRSVQKPGHFCPLCVVEIESTVITCVH